MFKNNFKLSFKIPLNWMSKVHMFENFHDKIVSSFSQACYPMLTYSSIALATMP